MAGFKHGKSTKVLWNQYDLSAYLNNSEVTASVDLPETTTYGAAGVRRQVVGLKDGSIALGGLHDTTTGATHGVLTGALAAASAAVFTRGVEGLALGAPLELVSIREASYQTGSPVDGVVPVNAECVPDGGVDYGKSLHDLAAETSTDAETSLDNAAGTTNGGVAHIHCTAGSGTDEELDVLIEESTNNSDWTTLVTFTQLTAAGSERIEVAAGTTVARYLRASWTIAGTDTPTFTFAVAFARR